MKRKALKILGILLISIIGTVQISIGQNDLLGNWKVSCATEITTANTISYCDICPDYTYNDDQNLGFKDFELTFEKEYLRIIIDGVSTKVDYTYEQDLEVLNFNYKETEYKFQVLFFYDLIRKDARKDKYILKDLDGMILLLEKKQ